MDRAIQHTAPYFDSRELRAELTANFRANGDDPAKAEAALAMLKLLLKSGMDIDSPHRIDEKTCEAFPATPLWYAYTRGRNEKLYKYLLKKGAEPNGCWWAIAWYDDIAAARVFLKHGADIHKRLYGFVV